MCHSSEIFQTSSSFKIFMKKLAFCIIFRFLEHTIQSRPKNIAWNSSQKFNKRRTWYRCKVSSIFKVPSHKKNLKQLSNKKICLIILFLVIWRNLFSDESNNWIYFSVIVAKWGNIHIIINSHSSTQSAVKN